MLEKIQTSTVLPSTPEHVYQAWLDSAEHAAFTGSPAQIDPTVGGRFSAWDGYIEGSNLILEPFQRIVQAWRTSEFPADSADSRLEVLLEAAKGGTRITLIHTEIPEGQGQDYLKGWEEFYFEPMQKYFAKAQ